MARAEVVGAILDNHVAALMEHVESVQIFVTIREGTATNAIHSGAGDWYARMGVVQGWLDDKRAVSRDRAIRADREAEERGGH